MDKLNWMCYVANTKLGGKLKDMDLLAIVP